MKPPGHDFYSAVAQLIPLLLVASVLEERTNRAEARRAQSAGRHSGYEGRTRSLAERAAGLGEGTLDTAVICFAIFGEVGAVAGLTGRGAGWSAALAIMGLALVGFCVALQFASVVVLNGSAKPWRVRTRVAAVLLTCAVMLLAAVVYAVRVTL